jgi:hypothetical protein
VLLGDGVVAGIAGDGAAELAGAGGGEALSSPW